MRVGPFLLWCESNLQPALAVLHQGVSAIQQSSGSGSLWLASDPLPTSLGACNRLPCRGKCDKDCGRLSFSKNGHRNASSPTCSSGTFYSPIKSQSPLLLPLKRDWRGDCLDQQTVAKGGCVSSEAKSYKEKGREESSRLLQGGDRRDGLALGLTALQPRCISPRGGSLTH